MSGKGGRIYNRFTGQEGVVLLANTCGAEDRLYVAWDKGLTSCVWASETCGSKDGKKRDEIGVRP